jgi:hypothetical protein
MTAFYQSATRRLVPGMPLESPGQQSFFDAYEKGVKGGEIIKDIFKLFIYGEKWAQRYGAQAGVAIPHQWTAGAALCGSAKNMLSLPEIPVKVLKLGRAMKELFDARSGSELLDKTKELFFAGSSCVSPAYDVVSELVQVGALKVCGVTMELFKKANFITLALNQGRLGGNNIYNLLTKKMTGFQQNSALFDLGKNTSYVALAFIGYISMTIAVAHASLLILACSTSVVFFSVTGYFYSELAKPNAIQKSDLG